MPPSKSHKQHKSSHSYGHKGSQGRSPKGTNQDYSGNKGKNEQESVEAEELHEWNESDLAAEGDHIEADAEFDVEYNITDMEAEEDLETELHGEDNGLQQQNLEQEHKKDEQVRAEQAALQTKTKKVSSPPDSSEEGKLKKFVIPKIRTASTEKQSGESKRSKDSSAQGTKDGGRNQSEKHETSFEDTIQLDEDNHDFQAEVDAEIDCKAEEETALKEKTQSSEQTTSEQRIEWNISLEIPEGKDSVAHLRETYPWQIRMYPVKRSDVTKPDFGKIWSMAQSSLITWTTRGDANGVAEFLLEDKAGIQMFMRKLMWFPFSTRYIIVEVIERAETQAEDGTKDHVHNTAVFRYDNHTARKLIKTYYPAATGEVTERSLYVNNVGMGVSADIMKAVFPCALRIGVAKASKDTSSALVQTESEEAAFNYMVVYHRVCVNGLDLELSTIKHDWQGARNKYMKTETGRAVPKTEGEKSSVTNPAKSDDSRKRSRASSPNAAQKERKVESSAPTKGRGRGSTASVARGRGRALSKASGLGLLPIPRPGGKGKGLLPPPLMSLPVSKPSPVDEFLMAQERGRRLAELEEARRQEAETRAAFHLATRRPEVGDQIADHVSLERIRRSVAPAVRSFSRSLDYEDEEESGRRPIPVRDEYAEREEWMRETAGYRRSRPLIDDFESKPYPTERQEETLPSRRLAGAPARPYLLEVPGEKDRYPDRAETDPYYGGSAARSARLDPEPRRGEAEERRTLLGRGGLLDIRDRYPVEEERVTPRSREYLDYHREQGQLGSLYSAAGSLDAREDARRSQLSPRYPAERQGSSAYGYESRY